MDTDVNAADLAAAMAPKSDQLNADDLRSGPRIFTISRLSKAKGGDGKRPLSIRLEEHKAGPWKPCKSEMRILAECWGKDPAAWPDGARVELWRNPAVRYGGEPVGGIQILAVSHMDKPLNTNRTISEKVREKCTIGVLPAARPAKPDRPVADLAQVLTDAELTINDFDDWRESTGKPVSADMTDAQRAQIAGWLAHDPARLEAIRAFVASTASTPDTDTADEGEE